MSITLQEIVEVDTSSVTASVHTSTTKDSSNNYRTFIRHGEHMGWLKDGKLFCQNEACEEMKKENGYGKCSLEFDENMKCEVVNEGNHHIHGPNCGHEKVPHADHYDYLVGSRLHHVVSKPMSCCNRQCLGHVKPSTIIDHGHVDVIKKQKINESDFLIENFGFSESITTNIYVRGICCQSETPIIQKIVKALPGVEAVHVNVVTKNVKILHDPSKTAPVVFLSALNAAGLEATIGYNMKMNETYASHFPWKLILCGIFLLASFCQYISDDVEYFKYIALMSVVIGIRTLLLRAYNSIKRMMLDMNVLMTIAIIGAIGLGDYTEAAAVVFLFGLSEWLEEKCMKYARGTINGLMQMQPAYATSAKDNKSIPVEDIKIGDVLVVRPGDRMPVNGEVISGSSLVDESLLTGESKSIIKKIDDLVISGSLNSGKSSLVIKATHLTSESMIARLASLVEDAAAQKSSTDRVIEKFAKIYTPVVVIIAVLLALMPFTHFIDNHKHWIKLSLVLLITACPCALVISTPVAVFCGISKAAQKSVLIKGGKYLETLSNLKVLTFDKTGTLTEGSFKVIDIKSFGEIGEDDVLAMAASLELHSTHPMAPAILGEAAARNILQKELAVDVKEIPGLGITGKIGSSGEMIAIGNLPLMEMVVGNLNKDILHKSFNIDQYRSDEKICYICNHSHVIGIIMLSDAIRYQAKDTLSKLKKMHLTLAMLTGDDRIVSESVAKALGIEFNNIHANLLPSDKLDIMQRYRHEYGPVAHVGDGANDSPALISADLGIAMGASGTALTIESADIALFTNDLSKIIDAIEISKKVKWKIVENIVLAILIKLLVFAFIIVGSVKLWHAVLADVGSSLLVTLNGLSVLFTDKNFFVNIVNFFRNRHHQNLSNQEIECYSKRRSKYQKQRYSHESLSINENIELGEISCSHSKKCCEH